MHRKEIGTAAALLALAVASCGGTAPLSRAELVKRGNAICRQRVASIAAAQRHSKGKMEAYVAAALPIASRSVDELAQLAPPAGLKPMYRAFLAGERSQIETATRALAALRAGRRADHGESVAALHRQARITRALGLEACV